MLHKQNETSCGVPSYNFDAGCCAVSPPLNGDTVSGIKIKKTIFIFSYSDKFWDIITEGFHHKYITHLDQGTISQICSFVTDYFNRCKASLFILS